MNETSNVGVSENLSIKANSHPKFFIVRTETIISKVYAVSEFEAQTAKEAIELVLNSDEPRNVVLAHKGERAVDSNIVYSDAPWDFVSERYPDHA